MPRLTKREPHEKIPYGWRRARLGEMIFADKEYKITSAYWNSGEIWENWSYRANGTRILSSYRPVIVKK